MVTSGMAMIKSDQQDYSDSSRADSANTSINNRTNLATLLHPEDGAEGAREEDALDARKRNHTLCERRLTGGAT
jgi:hypothetical protein